MNSPCIPLIVDLDGTLIKTDCLWEGFVSLLKINPFYIFLTVIWLIHGKAYLKQEIAKRIDLDPALLPYNDEFLTYLQQQRQQGRSLILATAADQIFAKKIANHLDIFDSIIASDGKNNLSGSIKLATIIKNYPAFVYAGNHLLDLPIWKSSTAIIIISSSKSLFKKTCKLNLPIEYKNISPISFKTIAKALRIHQWTKNILLFLPLLTAYKLTETHLLFLALKGFFAFSLCASSVYIINDLLDLAADRQHPQKKHRPFAAGDLSISLGLWGIPLLLLSSFALALNMSIQFSAVLGVYFFITVSYSFCCKKIVLLDVILLAMLYVIRIVGGGVAVNVPLSEWLLVFSLFLFLSLAFMKRASELYHLQNKNELAAAGRGYFPNDFEQVMSFGASSGYISVLVFALYINNDGIFKLYHHPQILWLCCPILLYWISRAWLLARRGQMHDDPVLFSIKDKVSYIVALLILTILCLAR